MNPKYWVTTQVNPNVLVIKPINGYSDAYSTAQNKYNNLSHEYCSIFAQKYLETLEEGKTPEDAELITINHIYLCIELHDRIFKK
jgi:hypothetical protein